LFGGSPIVTLPQMPRFMPFQTQPAAAPHSFPQTPTPGWTAQPAPQPGSAPPVRFPAQAADPRPVPIFRAQGNDADPVKVHPPRVDLSLPPPEALGIRLASVPGEAAALNAAVNWNQIHQRLRQLNPLGVNSVRLPAGNYRVTMRLATNQPDRDQIFEVVSNSEEQAYDAILQQAEQWTHGK
jgi:hypothetical protein